MSSRIFLAFVLFTGFSHLSWGQDIPATKGVRDEVHAAQKGCGRFDPSLNGLSFEIADVVIYANCLVYRESAFSNDDWNKRMGASDLDCDGRELEVQTLIQAIDVVIEGFFSYPRPADLVVSVDTDHGVTLTVPGTEVGAALLVLKGEVIPQFSEGSFAHWYHFDGLNTRILLSAPFGWDYIGQSIEGFSGRVLENDGVEILSIEMANTHGYPLSVTEPQVVQLSQNYPNPFNASTTITYYHPSDGAYRLTIINSLGQTVREWMGAAEAGLTKFEWDATNLPSGVYFYRLETPEFTETKKAVLIK